MHDSDSSSTDQRARGWRIIAAVVALAAVVTLVNFAPRVVAAYRARQWDTVPGQVTDRYSVGRQLHVEYSYAYDGRDFIGSRIGPTPEWVLAPGAAPMTLEPGNAVTVYVNPDAPDVAAIDVSLPWPALVASALAIVALGWAARAAWPRSGRRSAKG